ncbi:MAG TPA: hypothetical protein VGO47_03080, partial [Chlamydiales bacterium]|nr:hypothetical protein [Chlamydiales bacterium]
KTGGLANEGYSSPVRATTPVSAAGPSSLPLRSQTPKPSRLARLGFRQAVENLRAQVSQSEEQFNRFALEVHQACLHARTGEGRPREGTQTSAYLGFMSSTSLVGGPFHAKSGTSNELPEVKPPSLNELNRVLVRHASTGDMEGHWRLPHEAEVLSVLLMPYL